MNSQTHSPHTILLTIRTVRQKTQIDEVGIPMVLDPGALHQAISGPTAPTQLHQQTYTLYSSPNIFKRTL